MRQSIRFSELLRRAGLAGAWSGGADPGVTGVVEDSRQAAPGACFVATRGTQVDGHEFVNQAIAAGACAVVVERAMQVPENVALLKVESARGVAGRLAAALTGLDVLQRGGRFRLIGITGTNGKSTFCYLCRSILDTAGHSTAMLGTVEYDLVSRRIEATMTTPPATTLMAYLAEAVDAGARHAVMEVSSHALDQGRCDGVRFDVAVFSNLTGDHLDYHGTMDAYREAKRRLFTGLGEQGIAVINADDPAGPAMARDCVARVVWYGIEDDASQRAEGIELDVAARNCVYSPQGTMFDLTVAAGSSLASSGALESAQIQSPLVGRHNVQNALAAATAALASGVDLSAVAKGLASMTCVPGRLQRVASVRDDVTVLVDYAHTDDALENVLSALRPLVTGRLIVLFGCGGDRDRTKRPRMARVAARHADHVVVTSDNPRTEEPAAIIEEILAGFDEADATKVTVVIDRRAAIGKAVGMARAQDVVLLAGKGHETYQLIGGERLAFDDAVVAAEFLQAEAAGQSV